MSLSEEQQAELLRLVKLAGEAAKLAKAQNDLLAEGLGKSTELLRSATEDINVLLAFIRSKGLEPPKISYQA
jgi:hypothetical protein